MYRAAPRGLGWLLLCVFLLAGCERRQHLVEQHLLEFGTIIEISLITTDLGRAQALMAEIETLLASQRGYWHAWEDSDLTRFNAALARGEAVRVPASLAPLLDRSRHYYDLTGGLFNPALGKLIAAYGFHGSPADRTAIESIGANLPGMRDLVVADGRARSLNPQLQIDLGGIAKGYAVGIVAELLDTSGIEHYIVNAGGDLVTAGNRFGRPWRIGIQNPYAPGVIAAIELEGRHSLFTSGNYQRQYRRGETLTHHIIDPRSGDSARGQSSATVLATDPVLADVAATSLMIDGADNAARLARALALQDFLVVSDRREILLSPSMLQKIQIKVPWPTKIVK